MQIQHLSYLVQHERKNQVPYNMLILLHYAMALATVP